jgi:hypothetical protein
MEATNIIYSHGLNLYAYLRYFVLGILNELIEQKKNKQSGLSLKENYADRATAACRRSSCQLFADRGCRMVSATDPHSRILGLPDRNRYYLFNERITNIKMSFRYFCSFRFNFIN